MRFVSHLVGVMASPSTLRENTVHILDAATNRVLHDVKVGRSPDQIMFSNTFAFVRSLGTESVAMIRLATIGELSKRRSFLGASGP